MNQREQHQLLRDLRDATKTAREAATALAQQIALARQWDIDERCIECGKRERATGALCLRCAGRIVGAVTKDMIERGNPGAQVTLEACIQAITASLVAGGTLATVPDLNGHQVYELDWRGQDTAPWHGDALEV